ncbi:hypothetical protein WS99_29800 [Burkholderia territorii]|nr:hypothetical protein WS99_29800 [Burkholderia territorii]
MWIECDIDAARAASMHGGENQSVCSDVRCSSPLDFDVIQITENGSTRHSARCPIALFTAHRSTLTSTSTRTPARARAVIGDGLATLNRAAFTLSTTPIDRFAPCPVESFYQPAIRDAIASPTSCVPA